jgi:transglutaminase-like putative cysteine protease
LKISVVAFAALIVSAPAAFADTAYVSPVTVLNVSITDTLNADGTYTEKVVNTVRINTQQAVETYSHTDIAYSAKLESLKLVEAYTVTPAGKRVDVSPDKIADEENPLSSGAPMFSDERIMAVVFPELTIGAIKHYTYIETVKTPYFKNEFSDIDNFVKEFDYDHVTVTVNAPAAMPLYVESSGMSGGRQASADAARQVWVWTASGIKGVLPEKGAVSLADESPYVAITTFKTFADAGAAYRNGAAPAVAVTPKVQHLADQITHGITGQKAQEEALYNWVSKNIRYVGFEIGQGGVVPHPADEIIDAQYGDCKDHVTLLQALLAAKGIVSEGALVNAGDDYWKPGIPLPIGLFDHIITYIPGAKIFVDSTAQYAPFGVLPPQEEGKPALLTGTATTPAALVTLPYDAPSSDRLTSLTKVSISADGTETGSSTVQGTGVFEWIDRAVLGQVPDGAQPQLASQLLSMFNEQGSGNFTYADPRNLAVPFQYATSFSLPQVVNLPGPGSFQVPMGVAAFSGLIALPLKTADAVRAQPVPCVASMKDETTVVTLAPGMSVKFLPVGVKIQNAIGAYQSSYVQKGNVVTVDRQLTMHPPGPVCAPAQYQLERALGLAVGKDLRSSIIY